MKILDRYILIKFLTTFLFVVMIMAVIASVIDYTEKVDAFVEKQVPFAEIAGYFIDFVPHIIALLFPLFAFISTIYFTSKLAYKSEIIAILASGCTFVRFLRPYLIGAFILCGISLVANMFVIPIGNKNRIEFEDKYINSRSSVSDRNVHLRLSQNQYVNLESYDYAANVGYKFNAEKIEGIELKERIEAERVSFDSVKKVWNLYNVSVRTNDSLEETLNWYKHIVKTFPTFTPKDLIENNQLSATLTTPKLNEVIAREKLRGRENLNFYYVEKYRRSAQPFAAFLMIIIGVCLGSRKVRGGSGVHLALGVVICAVYVLMLQFSTTFSTKAGLNPWLAVWIPNFIFIFVTFFFLRAKVK